MMSLLKAVQEVKRQDFRLRLQRLGGRLYWEGLLMHYTEMSVKGDRR